MGIAGGTGVVKKGTKLTGAATGTAAQEVEKVMPPGLKQRGATIHNTKNR